jgi:hypothetical protein
MLSKWPPKKLEKQLRKEQKVKKATAIEKKEIVHKFESGIRVTDLANVHYVSTLGKLLVFLVNYAHYTTIFYYEKVRQGVLSEVRNALWVFPLFLMGKNLDLRPT